MMDIQKWIDEHSDCFVKASERIWELAEMKFEEHDSATILKDLLEAHGFTVQEGAAGMDTAFIASYGEGTPIVGILAEYDALAQLSQKADCFFQEKQEGMKNGHGCGHHLLGAASVAAAVAVKEYMREANIKGTIRLYGCPGEEGGSGKAFMGRAGVFDDVSCAFAWHPMSMNGVMNIGTLANIQAYFNLYGKSSHAAAAPHLGRSALDAVELMNVGVNYLREHIIPQARVHYAVTNTGGLSPNVVQAEAEVLYLIRAPHSDQAAEIYQRVLDIANGAALMTGTKVAATFDKACSGIVPNDTLGRLMHENMRLIGAPKFTDEEKAYAAQYIGTLSVNERKGDMETASILRSREMIDFMRDNAQKAVADEVMPYFFSGDAMPGSSDVGDVSRITPTAQCFTACYAASTPAHSWQMTAQGKSAIARKGMLYAAKVMAQSALQVFQQPEIAQKAQEELKAYLGDKRYVCPIPAGVEPKAYKRT